MELDIIGRELTGVATFSWGRKNFLKQGELTDKYKMLNLIAVANFAPIKRSNEILPKMARLLYAIGKRHNIDHPSLILSEMKKGFDAKRSALPFGTIVIELCLENGIRIKPEMEMQKPLGLLDKGFFKRSQEHSGGSAARQEVPPAQGGDEMQEEIDYKDTLIGEQSRRSGQQQQAIENCEYTISRFRELVTSLQADLEDMRASRQITETEAEELSSRSRAMMDLFTADYLERTLRSVGQISIVTRVVSAS